VKRSSKRFRWIRFTVLTAVACGAVIAVTAWLAVRKTSHVPDFYVQAKARLPERIAEASRRLQTDMKQLHDDAGKRGSWHAAFSDNEINAWLVQELPTKFPKLLAKGASDPRVMIEDNRILAAVRYHDRRIDTIISCEVSVELTEEPNMLAVRVSNLRAGSLSLPLSGFLAGISREAATGDIDIRWDLTDDGPIAIVAVPSEHPGYVHKPVVVESVKLVAGQLLLSGRTGPAAHEAYQPRGSVHRFVSYRVADNRNCKTRRTPSSQSSDRMR
jgi:hypothetical protein